MIAHRVLQNANAVRVVSERLKQQIMKDFAVAERKITVVPIYSDFSKISLERKPHGNSFVFLTISRLVPIKNISLQIRVRALCFLGLDLTAQISDLLSNLRTKKGVVVARVSSLTPYSQQGRLQAGDVVYSLNGKIVEGVADLNTALTQLKPSSPAILHLERSGTLIYLAFRLER